MRKDRCARRRAIDFVARNEFDFTIKDVADGKPLAEIEGLSWRDAAGAIVHNADRAVLENMDALPFVTPIYRRDLDLHEVFRRLPQASVRELLHRTRLQEPMHVLPVAADRRRPQLPHALDRRT